MSDIWEPKPDVDLPPVRVEEDEEHGDGPRVKVWPAAGPKPDNPPRWSLRLVREWWRKQG